MNYKQLLLKNFFNLKKKNLFLYTNKVKRTIQIEKKKKFLYLRFSLLVYRILKKKKYVSINLASRKNKKSKKKSSKFILNLKYNNNMIKLKQNFIINKKIDIRNTSRVLMTQSKSNIKEQKNKKFCTLKKKIKKNKWGKINSKCLTTLIFYNSIPYKTKNNFVFYFVSTIKNLTAFNLFNSYTVLKIAIFCLYQLTKLPKKKLNTIIQQYPLVSTTKNILIDKVIKNNFYSIKIKNISDIFLLLEFIFHNVKNISSTLPVRSLKKKFNVTLKEYISNFLNFLLIKASDIPQQNNVLKSSEIFFKDVNKFVAKILNLNEKFVHVFITYFDLKNILTSAREIIKIGTEYQHIKKKKKNISSLKSLLISNSFKLNSNRKGKLISFFYKHVYILEKNNKQVFFLKKLGQRFIFLKTQKKIIISNIVSKCIFFLLCIKKDYFFNNKKKYLNIKNKKKELRKLNKLFFKSFYLKIFM